VSTQYIYPIPEATNTFSEYVILINVPGKQRLHERASVLRHTSFSYSLLLPFQSPLHILLEHVATSGAYEVS